MKSSYERAVYKKNQISLPKIVQNFRHKYAPLYSHENVNSLLTVSPECYPQFVFNQKQYDNSWSFYLSKENMIHNLLGVG